jgi:hypothetical protein
MHESSHTSVIVADDSRCVSKFPTKAQNGPVQRKVHDFCPTSVDYFLACRGQNNFYSFLIDFSSRWQSAMIGDDRRWSQETNFFVSCDVIAGGRRRSRTIGDIIFDVFL